jgi:nucleotide sugar dehydrogenase
MNIGVIGVGRLGICFALLLDRAGHGVMGCDIRSSYIAGLQRREIHTAEPGVAAMLKDCDITFTTDTRSVIASSDIIYVMVATPSLADGSYDISAIDRVVSDIGESDFDLTNKFLVIGCTTNPGDCQRIQDRLRDRGIRVLYNPEFIAQGSIIHDLQHADMVLIGGEDSSVIDCYKLLYNDIQVRVPDVHAMSLTAAELVKIATNCFLTTKISYANMMGEVLIRSGLEFDVDRALAAIGADGRIGHRYLRYGIGYGGPCFPRDNRAFATCAQKVGLDFPLGHIVDRFNQDHTVFLMEHWIRKNPQRLPFFLRTLAYKAGTDIYEESQQMRLAELLMDREYRVVVEPCNKMPESVRSSLVLKWGNLIEFRARNQLATCVEITL